MITPIGIDGGECRDHLQVAINDIERELGYPFAPSSLESGALREGIDDAPCTSRVAPDDHDQPSRRSVRHPPGARHNGIVQLRRHREPPS